MRILFFFLFILSTSLFSPLNAQCPEDDLEITTQSEMYAFQRIYPNCTEINGNVSIGQNSSNLSDIYDVTPLQNITIIKGQLNIRNCPLIRSFNSLNLNSIKGGIYLSNLNELEDIDFISSLDSLFSLQLASLKSLQNINGISNFEEIHGNISLTELPSLSPPLLLKASRIEGAFSCYNLDKLQNLTFLSNLEYLENLSIYRCNNLINIDGVSFIKNDPISISIVNNVMLDGCNTDAICPILARTEYININNNGLGCQSNLEVIAACGSENVTCPLEDIDIYTQSELNFFGSVYGQCTELKGSLHLSSDTQDPIVDLSPLSHIEAIEGNFSIRNTELGDLVNLENLEYIGGSLSFYTNDRLESFEGIDNLKNLSSLTIYENNSLFSTESFPFAGQRLEYISINLNENLIDIKGIELADTIKESLYLINNNRLAEIDNVISLKSIGQLFIQNMPALEQLVSPPDTTSNVEIEKIYIRSCDQLSKIALNETCQINENISISYCQQLTDLEISATSTSLDFISLSDCENLRKFKFSPDLLSVDNNFYISRCDSLASLSFENLKKVGTLILRDFKHITSFGSSSKLDSIGYLSIVNNSILNDLSAFNRNIAIDSILISNNPNLSDCQILPICNVQDLSKIRLGNNAPNCNSLSTVYTVCNDSLKNPVGDVVLNNKIDIEVLEAEYPNADSIFGALRIEFYDSLSHADLAYFQQIEYIQDGLFIGTTGLDSLDYLKDIALDLINISNMDNLVSMPVWSKIDTLKSLSLNNMPSLNDISGFSTLKVIKDDLRLSSLLQLSSINGFQNIESIGNITFRSCGLDDLDEFNNLTSLNSFYISTCHFLQSIEGLSNITNCYSMNIRSNNSLRKLMTPINQDSIYYFWLHDNPAIESFNSLDNITKCGRLLRVSSNDAIGFVELPKLTSMGTSSIIGLTITDNNSLNSISFPKLEYCSNLEISRQENLIDLGNFSALSSCDRLSIVLNDQLDNISNFDTDFTVSESILIYNNAALKLCNQPFLCDYLYKGKELVLYGNDIGCETEAQIEIGCGFVPELCPSSDYWMRDGRSVELYNLHYDQCIALPGSLTMDPNFGLNPQIGNLQMIADNLNIETTTIPSLNFTDLKSLGRNLIIEDTRDLSSISFPNLEELNGRFTSYLHIIGNQDLSATPSFDKLDLQNRYQVEINDNFSLIEIDGFDQLTTADYVEISNNPQLVRVEGFNSLESLSLMTISNNEKLTSLPVFNEEKKVDEINLTNNPLLANCSIPGICIHIDNDRTATIQNNKQGCNSKEEILSNCLVNVDNILNIDYFTVYPNPTEGRLQIVNEQELPIEGFELFDLSGRLIKSYDRDRSLIDISQLFNGVYILKIHTPKGIGSIKVVKW